MRWAAAVALAAAGLAALAAGAPAAPTRSQEFFREKLLDDPGTSRAISEMLRARAGFVHRTVNFVDLTGDRRDDAVVRVQSAGAAGVVAIYVFSTHGRRPLRALYRQQKLVRASARATSRALTFRTARYEPGNELCCPRTIGETEVRWDRERRRFRVHETRVIAPPPPEPS